MDPQQPTQQPPTNPTPPPSLPKPHSKLPLILGILFLSLFILVGSYMIFGTKKASNPPVSKTLPTAIPTADPTANWKTYTNTDNGFSFKYPQSDLTKLEQNDYLSINEQLSFTISETSISECTGICSRILKTEQIPVNNNTFTKYTTQQVEDMDWPNDAKPEQIHYEVKLSNNMLGVFRVGSLYSESPEYLNNLNTLNQILSTFTFLDQTETRGMDSWKTYRFTDNDGFGYELKIPFNWANKQREPGPALPETTELDQDFYKGDCTIGSGITVLHNQSTNAQNEINRNVDSYKKGWSFTSDTIKIGSISAVKLTGNYGPTDVINYEVLFPSPKGFYHISGISDKSGCMPDFSKTFDQILTTFKFLE